MTTEISNQYHSFDPSSHEITESDRNAMNSGSNAVDHDNPLHAVSSQNIQQSHPVNAQMAANPPQMQPSTRDTAPQENIVKHLAKKFWNSELMGGLKGITEGISGKAVTELAWRATRQDESMYHGDKGLFTRYESSPSDHDKQTQRHNRARDIGSKIGTALGGFALGMVGGGIAALAGRFTTTKVGEATQLRVAAEKFSKAQEGFVATNMEKVESTIKQAGDEMSQRTTSVRQGVDWITNIDRITNDNQGYQGTNPVLQDFDGLMKLAPFHQENTLYPFARQIFENHPTAENFDALMDGFIRVGASDGEVNISYQERRKLTVLADMGGANVAKVFEAVEQLPPQTVAAAKGGDVDAQKEVAQALNQGLDAINATKEQRERFLDSSDRPIYYNVTDIFTNADDQVYGLRKGGGPASGDIYRPAIGRELDPDRRQEDRDGIVQLGVTENPGAVNRFALSFGVGD